MRIQTADGGWVRERNAARRLEEGEPVCVHSRLFAEGIAPEGVVSKPSARDVQRIRDSVLFEDEDCIVINKPSGLAVQGGSKIPKGKHLDRMMPHVVSAGTDVRLVHRLDRETSGCLVMAKSRGAATALATAFEEGRVEKLYVALVAGCIPKKSGMTSSYKPRRRQSLFLTRNDCAGVIRASLLKVGAPGGHDRVQCVPTSQGGLEASTRYRVLLDAAGDGEGRVSLVALWPESGRTHQLRVHCAERLGAGKKGEGGDGACYIIGDAKYGPKHHHLSVSSGANVVVTEQDRARREGEADHGRATSRGHNLSAEKVRLCLHALRIRLRWGEQSGTRGPTNTKAVSVRNEISCMARVPEHFITTAEKCGFFRRDVEQALDALMRKATAL